MKRSILTALVLSGILSSTVLVSAQTIKLGTLAPEGSPWYTILRDMAEDWKRLTNSKIRFRIYPGGIAGDDPDMVRKIRVGQLHAAVLSGEGLFHIAPEIQALQMPMMLSSYDELDYVRIRLAPKFESVLEAKGFKVLNWGYAGWVRLFAQKPVVRPDDLKRLRLFTWAGNAAYLEAWKAAGYNPVPLPASEIHTGLQSGLINAFTTTPVAALSFQWFGLAKHMTDLKWAPLVGATVISTHKWMEISNDARPFLLRSSRAAGVRFQREVRTFEDDAIRVMKKHGLVVHNVPSDVITEWERSAHAGYAKIVGKVIPPHIIREVESLRNEYRTSHSRR